MNKRLRKKLFDLSKHIFPMWIVEILFVAKLDGQFFNTDLGHCRMCGSLSCKGECEPTY
jgi:hypothetical protein